MSNFWNERENIDLYRIRYWCGKNSRCRRTKKRKRPYHLVPSFLPLDIICFEILRFVPLKDLITKFLRVNSFFYKLVWRSLKKSRVYTEKDIIGKENIKELMKVKTYRRMHQVVERYKVKETFYEKNSDEVFEDCQIEGRGIGNLRLLLRLLKCGCFDLKKCGKKLLFYFMKVRELYKRNCFENSYKGVFGRMSVRDKLGSFIHSYVNLKEFEAERNDIQFKDSFIFHLHLCSHLWDESISRKRVYNDNEFMKEIAKSGKFFIPSRDDLVKLGEFQEFEGRQKFVLFYSILLSTPKSRVKIRQSEFIRFLNAIVQGCGCECCPSYHLSKPFISAVNWCIDNKKYFKESGIHLTKENIYEFCTSYCNFGSQYVEKIDTVLRFIRKFGILSIEEERVVTYEELDKQKFDGVLPSLSRAKSLAEVLERNRLLRLRSSIEIYQDCERKKMVLDEKETRRDKRSRRLRKCFGKRKGKNRFRNFRCDCSNCRNDRGYHCGWRSKKKLKKKKSTRKKHKRMKRERIKRSDWNLNS